MSYIGRGGEREMKVSTDIGKQPIHDIVTLIELECEVPGNHCRTWT